MCALDLLDLDDLLFNDVLMYIFFGHWIINKDIWILLRDFALQKSRLFSIV